jgi:large subunit ribosomal protein L15
MPLIRRLPKRGFSNAAFKKKIAIVNLVDLAELSVDGTIDEQALRAHGLIRGHFDGVKVLGNGELSKKLAIQADFVSATAREKIEAAGGTVTIRERAGAAKAA